MITSTQERSLVDTELRAILEQEGVVSLFQTDGAGKIAASLGDPVDEALATRLELLWGAARDESGSGNQETAVLAYERRLLVMVRLGRGLCVAVATTGSVLGLLFNRLRSLNPHKAPI